MTLPKPKIETEERGKACSFDWQKVWLENQAWLRRVVHARLQDSHAVDEVVQEMALNISRISKKPTCWPDAEKLAPWLYRVAIRQVHQYRRQLVRTKKQIDRLTSIHVVSGKQEDRNVEPLDYLIHCEAEELVRNAMRELGGQDREILVLKHTENLTYEQIAEQTGISLDKVIYRIGRARKRLRALISETI